MASGWPRLSYFPHPLGTLAAPRSSANTCCVFATEQWDTWKGIGETFPCFLQHTYAWGLEILVNRTLPLRTPGLGALFIDIFLFSEIVLE